MRSDDHELLDDLLAQAALGTGWPTLHVLRSSEADLDRARHDAESVLGPLPQAEVLVPWGDEPWELRVDLPGLTPTLWASARGVLQDVALRPGLRAGARLAADEGVSSSEPLEADGLTATLRLDEEGPLSPDLARARRADPDVEALEVELAEAVRRVDVRVAFRSDRGPDTVTPIVHRPTGRFGVQVAFDAGTADHREALLGAVAGVVRARARHPRLRLAPDLLWDARLDALQLTLWIVGPAAPPLPGDDLVERGLVPADPWALLADPSQCEDLELQVVPVSAAAHDAVVARVLGALAPRGGGDDASLELHVDGWRGGAPRWLRTPDGWRFTPTWRVLRDAVDGALTHRLRALVELDEVAAVRIVPGEPVGLGDAWRWAEPAWTWAGRRCFLRVRDGVADRDRLPAVDDRAPTPRDVELDAVARLRLGAARPGRAIVDGGGRDGVEWALEPWSFAEAPLRAALHDLGDVDHPELAPVAHVAHRGDHTIVRLWYRAEGAEPAPWR